MTPYGSGKILGMIFIQCTLYFANAGENRQGSIQAGTVSGQPNLWCTPVGFPGRALPGSGVVEEGGKSALQNLTPLSSRDVP